jgi:hypothetical protein
MPTMRHYSDFDNIQSTVLLVTIREEIPLKEKSMVPEFRHSPFSHASGHFVERYPRSQGI